MSAAHADPAEGQDAPRPSESDRSPVVTIYCHAKDVDTSAAEVLELPTFATMAQRLEQPPQVLKNKRRARLMTRGGMEGRRCRENMRPPFQCPLDVDGGDVPPEVAAENLKAAGVPFVIYTTWSFGSAEKPGPRFRVVTNRLAMGPRSVAAVTAEIAKKAGVIASPDSYKVGTGFFLPTCHPERTSPPPRPTIADKLYRFIADYPPDCPWEVMQEPAAEDEESPPVVTPSNDPLDVEDLRAALAVIPNADRARWVEIGMALHHEEQAGRLEPGQGHKFWDDWSSGQDYPDYDDAEQERVWDSFHREPGDGKPAVKAGTIFHHAKEYGYRPKPPAPPSLEEAREAFAKHITGSVPLLSGRARKYEYTANGALIKSLANAVLAVEELDLGLHYDELADRIMMTGAGVEVLERTFPKMGRIFNDAALDNIGWVVGRRVAEFTPDLVLRAVRTLANNRRLNPVETWLRGLTWDGVSRVATWTSRLLGTAAGPYESAVGRITLVAPVARTFEPGIKHDCLPVLESRLQGIGKTQVVKVLGGEYTLEGLGTTNLHDKDVVSRLIGKWFVELDEMEVASRADIAALKGFLSRTVDTVRPAYERTARDFPRRCVFIGTTNEERYLRDATGNRRFLPLRLPDKPVDLEGLRAEREQLFAEAVVLWLADPRPEALVLPPDLWPHAAREQAERLEEDGWEEDVRHYLAVLERDREQWILGEPRVTTSEVLEGIGKKTADRRWHDLKRVAAILHRLGWEDAKSGGIKFWRLEVLG